MSDSKLSKLTKDERLEQLDKWFTDSVSWDHEWREKSEFVYSMYHGEQWTEDEANTLRERGQAVTTYNHIAPAIDAIVGGERQNRPEISMVGRTPDDERIAQAKTELYKYITYNSQTDEEEDKMFLDALVVGRGWMSVYPNTIGDKFDDILHAYVDYRDMFTDPFSKRDDLKDARYVSQAVFTDEDIIKKSFPKYEGSTGKVSGFEGSSDDNIYFGGSSNVGDRPRVRLINTWFRDENGDVSVSIWVKGQELYHKKKPYQSIDLPFTMVTLKRDLNNFPYGLVDGMTSAQEEVNKRHSKAMHYLNAKQVLAEEDAFTDWKEAEKTLAKPDGITKLNDGALAEGRIQIVDNVALASTHIQMMEIAKTQVLNLAGINPSYLGQSSGNSAAAQSQEIAGASNTLVPTFNKFRSARQRTAFITMALVPDFYTDERLVRILNPNGSYAFMPINTPQLMDDGTIEMMNDLSVNDVDVIIEDAPSSLDDRAQQFNQLLQIQGQTGRPIPMEILLRYSGLKDKYSLADELKSHYDMEAQLQQAQQAMEQMQQQIQQMGGQVDQITSQLIQSNVARAVDKEVGKAKQEISKEKDSIQKKINRQ